MAMLNKMQCMPQEKKKLSEQLTLSPRNHYCCFKSYLFGIVDIYCPRKRNHTKRYQKWNPQLCIWSYTQKYVCWLKKKRAEINTAILSQNEMFGWLQFLQFWFISLLIWIHQGKMLRGNPNPNANPIPHLCIRNTFLFLKKIIPLMYRPPISVVTTSAAANWCLCDALKSLMKRVWNFTPNSGWGFRNISISLLCRGPSALPVLGL